LTVGESAFGATFLYLNEFNKPLCKASQLLYGIPIITNIQIFIQNHSMTYSNHLLPIPIYKGDTRVPADKDDVE
jgi:hypothetical protein